MELLPHGVASIGYACTSASYVCGAAGERGISKRLSDATGLPATTTSGATVTALSTLGIERVAVLSPHVNEINEKLKAFLEESGVSVVRIVGLNLKGDIEKVSPEDILRLVVAKVDSDQAEGVFISCTGMMTSSILEETEKAIGKPLVTANQATMWQTLRLAGAPSGIPALGRLYAKPVLLP